MQDEKFDASEGFGSLAAGNELKLFADQKWTIWENYEMKDEKKDAGSWANLMRKVAWFDNMISFH